jgi:acyl carrier protein
VVLREMDNAPTETLRERQLIAYVVPDAAVVPTERELRSFLKTKLPLYMLPGAVVVLDALPLTANGKVNQKALPPPHVAVAMEASPTIAPTTSLEASLVEVWTQLLGRTVGIHDNFFELGGHSLLATQLVSRLRDRLQVELPLRSVFEASTIAALAEKIEALQAAQTVSSMASRQPAAQRREEVEL